MLNILLLLINVATVVTIFVTSTGIIVDKRRKWHRQLTKRGWFFVACCFILILLPLFQNKYLQSQAKFDQDERDKKMLSAYEIAIRRLKLSSDSNTNGIIKTLAEYDFAYNTTQKKIEKLIRDSARTTIVQSENPTLEIMDVDNAGIRLFNEDSITYTYAVGLCSHDAASTEINLKMSFLLSPDFINFYYYDSAEIFGKQASIPKEGGKTGFFTILKARVLYTHKYFIGWVRGPYKNRDGSKNFTLDEVCYYNVMGNGFGTIENQTREKIISIVKLNEK